ncbi:MAG: thioesterase family protein [Caulobacteraceae bacterium]|nr:thioesterase family protein [Caulobacteraceae bacterium]
MPSLRAVLSQLEPCQDGFAIDAPEGWTQGRTLYGGMTTALCQAALHRALAPPAPLRSVQIAFAAPAAGRLVFRPNIVRQGRSSLVAAVDCEGETGPVARATFVFAAARESLVHHDAAAAPAVAAPTDCPAFLPDEAPRPEFTRHFEVRLAAGARPGTGAAEAEFTAWVRFREDEGEDAVTALLALGDCLPPAAIVQFPTPAPLSSMTWSVDLHPPIPSGGWRLLRSSSEQAADGYSLQGMELWSQDGRRLAVGRQCVAYFI